MTGLNRCFARTFLFLLSYSSVLACGVQGQAPAISAPSPVLVFEALPSKQLLALGEPVVLVLYLRNESEEPIFVSLLKNHEFVDFNIVGPDGKEVPWQGKGRINSKGYSPSDFTVLERYQEVSAKRTISVKDGTGFVFDKPGQYSVTAEYSLAPPEYFAPFAGQKEIPKGSLSSSKAAFCIEVCVHLPTPGPIRVRRNVSQSALDAVRGFYTNITKYRPLGIPTGRTKKDLWPFLSKRLVGELDSLQACEDDYYRRYGETLRANQYKPATPWLEEGLFSGPVEAAGPTKFSILGSRAIGENRVDVHLSFTSSASSYPLDGVVTAISENNRWVIDDFVAMYANDELLRLSDGYSECKGGRWVGEPPY